MDGVSEIVSWFAFVLIVFFISDCVMRIKDKNVQRDMYSECLKSTKDCDKWLE